MNIHDLHRLGQKTAEQMGEGPGDGRIAEQRDAVMEILGSLREPAPRRVGFPALAGAAGLAVLVAVFSWFFWPQAAKTRRTPEEGMILTARTTPLVMELPGGNSARLAPDSVGQLAVSTPEEVRVVLIHGELTSTVRTPVRWSVQAGSYVVMAAGTEYVVRWQNEKLEVRVQKGRVQVLGRDAPRAGWFVDAGETFTIDRGRLLEKTGGGSSTPEVPATQPEV
ncbi:FecR family protein, partial [Myxococcota bacterium]|nr:FecR family protein [Myxococcota bacterium]